MITQEEITKFQKIYSTKFGKELSQEEAYEKGAMLIQAMRLIYKPMTLREYRNLQKRREETENINL